MSQHSISTRRATGSPATRMRPAGSGETVERSSPEHIARVQEQTLEDIVKEIEAKHKHVRKVRKFPVTGPVKFRERSNMCKNGKAQGVERKSVGTGVLGKQRVAGESDGNKEKPSLRPLGHDRSLEDIVKDIQAEHKHVPAIRKVPVTGPVKFVQRSNIYKKRKAQRLVRTPVTTGGSGKRSNGGGCGGEKDEDCLGVLGA